jgi:RNA polymerase sigma factor (sigma-70 family)
MTPDCELLRRYAGTHSEEAFAELVRRHVNLVYSAALRQVNGDAHLAQDVAQTVFADLAHKASSLSRRATLTGWLYTSAHYAAAKIVRGENRRRDREEKFMREPISETALELDWEKLHPMLDEAMHELKEADREAILLRYFENCQFAEIGGKLGLNENVARMRVERALEKLRAVFLRRGITATTALASVISANAVQIAPAGLAVTLTSTSLAGAGTGTLTLLKLMTMTKLKLGLSALVIAGATTTLVVQHQSCIKLREENQSLRQHSMQLETTNERLTKLVAHSGSSEPPSNELLRLRGEAGVLRQQNQELARLLLGRQKTVPASSQTGDFEPSTAWVDAGNATPEAAAETFSWAIRAGNQDKLAEVVMFEPDPADTNSTAAVEAMSNVLEPLMSEIEKSKLILTENPAPDEVTFWYQSQFKDGHTMVSPLTLKHVGNTWKVKLISGGEKNEIQTGQ